jgi:hypothetical protein
VVVSGQRYLKETAILLVLADRSDVFVLPLSPAQHFIKWNLEYLSGGFTT